MSSDHILTGRSDLAFTFFDRSAMPIRQINISSLYSNCPVWVLGSYQEGCTQDWCSRSMVSAKAAGNRMVPLCAEWRCDTDNWATTPIVYCSTMASLPLWPHCANARRIRCQADLISFPRRTGGDHQDVPIVRGWRLFSRTWNQWTCPWTKQSTRLRIVHSGDRCLRLALRTHSGACQKRTSIIVTWVVNRE